MRRLLLTALALGALPAIAQTDTRTVEREVIIDRDDADAPVVRRMVIVNGDTTVDERRGGHMQFFSEDGRTVVLEGDNAFIEKDEEVTTDGGTVRLRVERDGDEVTVRQGDGADANVVRLQMSSPDGFRALGDEMVTRMRTRFMAQPGVSAETRQRMRALEMQSQTLARRARSAEGDARRDAIRELDGVLGELFEVRGDARREEAAALRERAAELQTEADEIDAAASDRASRRQALIDARRAELMGERASDW